MKKLISVLVAVVMALSLTVCLCGCAIGGGDKGNTPGNDNPVSELPAIEGVEFKGASVDYDGQPHQIEVSGLPEGASVTYKANKATDAGTYEAEAVVKKAGYADLKLTAKLTINKIDLPDNLVFNGAEVVYDGKSHKIELESVPSGAEVSYKGGEKGNSAVEEGDYNITATVSKRNYNDKKISANLKIRMPSGAEVSAAREAVKNNEVQNYEFLIKLSGSVSMYEFETPDANAIYEGRYDTDGTNVRFFRKTSGILLYDSREYIYNTSEDHEHKIRLKVDENDVAKKLSVVKDDEDPDLVLLNLPFVKIVDSLKADNIIDIEKSDLSGYLFKSKIKLDSENPILDRVLKILEKLGTSITIKGVTLPNIAKGVDFYFNMKDNKLDTFEFGTEISFDLDGQGVGLRLFYSQKPAENGIDIPSTEGISVKAADIQAALNKIKAAADAVKADESYSIDMEAKNEFDPGWNKLAIVDSYKARLYKHVDDFNHSYEFKSHTEDEGAEKYKYTIGNVTKDPGVWKISRKGGNTQEEMNPAPTHGMRFDYLLSAVLAKPADVDCVKTTDGKTDGEKIYEVFLGDASAKRFQQKILEIVNSNEADGVEPVNNHIGDKYDVRDAVITIKVNGEKITEAACKTTFKYVPTEGEYKAGKITLTDSVEIFVNKNLDKAQEYTAPETVDTHLTKLGLNNAKFYIL